MKKEVSVILQDENEKILLQLREDSPGVNFPGKWGLFGGGVESDETPKQAACREIREELGIDLEQIDYIGVYHFEKAREDFLYVSQRPIEPDDILLKEGKDFDFFTPKKIMAIDLIVPYDRRMLIDYLSSLP